MGKRLGILGTVIAVVALVAGAVSPALGSSSHGSVPTSSGHADKTLYKRADSWYLGSNIAGKPRTFMIFVGGFDTYMNHLNDAVANNYEGFVLGR